MRELDRYLLTEIEAHLVSVLEEIVALSAKGKCAAVTKAARAGLTYAKSAQQIAKNPAKRGAMSAELQRAVKLYTDFHGEKPRILSHVKFSKIPKNILQVGKCVGIMYRAKRDGKTLNFLHQFAAHAGPILAATADGRQLLLIGGNYVFTEDGITDVRIEKR